MGILRGLSARGWRTRLWHPPERRGIRGPFRRLLDIIATQWRLMTRRERPQILYVRGHFASLPSVLWARLMRVPVVWEQNSARGDVLSSWPQVRPLLPLLEASGDLQMRLSTAVIAVTAELSQSAREHGARRCYVVPNGADTELFAPTATSSMVLPERFVSFHGTLATWQGIEHLLDALDRPAWPAHVALVVIGDGVLEDVVRAKSRIDPRVRYLGRVRHREVAGIVARSLAAISPQSGGARARSGVVPLKLFEAMACGVPVIVTDLPGQANIVSHNGCGLVVPPDDPSAIAAAVATLDSHPRLAQLMGQRARKTAVAQFSWDALAARTHAILVGLVDA
ncbi:MAG: glycosyltransferase family 4 protein [Candidatus Limnocylindrales bacterium]